VKDVLNRFIYEYFGFLLKIIMPPLFHSLSSSSHTMVTARITRKRQDLSLGVKLSVHAVNNLLPLSIEVKKDWSYTSNPYTSFLA
jgi:hypothetical protein